ncbi:hypothetical protein [Rhodopseudomonas telluris]|uniref:Uncharacterized protein n=1 Tax=Rhodopseudomonas telluris TaxID=644215 RepID=A0ABV6EZL2_9BRAD
MQLQAHQQIAVSAVKADSIRPGEIFEINDALGADLLKAHPEKFTRLDADDASKAEPAPQNKAERQPSNKAQRKPQSKQTTEK